VRLLLVISDLAFHGAQKQVVELSRGLAARGHEVCIYTLNDDAPRERELEGSGVQLIVDQKRSKLDWAVVGRLRAKIRAMRADIVHGFLYDGDIYARVAAFGTGAKVLNSERSADYTLSRGQKVGHVLTRWLVDGVVANSRYGARFAQKLYGYDPEHMHVVWNGMKVEELERRAVSSVDHRAEFFGPGDYKVACMVGHIKPAKDYPLALDTAAELVRLDPSWRVLFIGDSLSHAAYKPGQDSDTSDYKRAAMEQYQRLGIAERVKFAGARSDCPAILAQCDVQFHTSKWEGFPNAVLEGMALGVPVVSTDYSDIRDILPRDSQVVENRQPPDLARAIIAAYRDREAIAAEQRRWVRAHATIDNATRELERVYSLYVRPDAYARAA
jgi:glycosyltransferase involved in cell wall biosynthesis